MQLNTLHARLGTQGLVAVKQYLWLNLTEIREMEKVFLLDAPIMQSDLFGEAVSSVVDKFHTAKTQSAALSSSCLGRPLYLQLLPQCPGTALHAGKTSPTLHGLGSLWPSHASPVPS